VRSVDVIVYPAIDILGGNVVRLRQGDFDDSTTYQSDPLAAAQIWARAGAERLHVVDLDGARAGVPVNLDHVQRIALETGLTIQLGGGLRSDAAIDAAIAAGASRIVLGTAAFNHPELLDRALAVHGAQIAVSVDARGGNVATAGWTLTGSLSAIEAVGALAARGVRNFVYTDVDRDGMLGGLDIPGIARVADAVVGELLYSGGIATIGDLGALTELAHPQIAGVIIGKALYEGHFTIEEATEALCS
jgi:phosphoribosylformimino-5-aminoimidazole carboxamide ribotide isomerase